MRRVSHSPGTSVWFAFGLVACAAAPKPALPPPAKAPPVVAASVMPVAPSAAPAAPLPPNPYVTRYADAAQRIRDAAAASDRAYSRLAELTDTIGPRLSGSDALQRATVWAKESFLADGQERVALEAVRVPHWVRGGAAAAVLEPVARPFEVLALGGSVATPARGITAELIAVGSFAELDARKAEARGKIVLFDHPMGKEGNAGMNYGEALPYRTTGAARAAPLGAVAVLVRSLTAHSLGSPHTGSMRYLEPKDPKIPAASISVETAEWLHRLANGTAKVKLTLTLTPKTLPDADSANVVADLRGREHPEDIVVIGAHLDSWDVGQGAQDDGSNAVCVMQALATLRTLGLVPRRTIRAVLFTNEENGVRGGKQYAEAHRSERHAAAFEADAGAGAPLGFMTDGEQPFLGEAQQISALLQPLGANSVMAGFAGEDIGALAPARVPLFGLRPDISHYFDVHHSAADTLDKIDPENLKKTVAVLATMAFVVADQEATWVSKVASTPK